MTEKAEDKPTFKQIVADGTYHSLSVFHPVVTEYKVFLNGLEIRGDEKWTEVKIAPVSTQPIPPYNFKSNAQT
jgi:hypothetical protein